MMTSRGVKGVFCKRLSNLVERMEQSLGVSLDHPVPAEYLNGWQLAGHLLLLGVGAGSCHQISPVMMQQINGICVLVKAMLSCVSDSRVRQAADGWGKQSEALVQLL
jgi:hypothetical protein